MPNTRMPIQKRSIEKRDRIIAKGFELMCNNGYYKTNTSDIALYAGVSTGIIYQYFNDKKEIFIEGIKNYSDSIMFPMLSVIDNSKINIHKLDIILDNMIDKFIERHTLSNNAHEEMMAMSHIDIDIGKIFHDKELEVTNKIVNILNNSNVSIDNAYEKVHIIIGIIENLCHEIVYHKHNNIDYSIMKKEVINIIISILEN